MNWTAQGISTAIVKLGYRWKAGNGICPLIWEKP
jgi:hypothetical protein